MNDRRRGTLLCVIQCILVLTIAGKYLYERKACPRVWARAVNFDPSSPMRGRCLVLSAELDACALPPAEATTTDLPRELIARNEHYWSARVVAQNGKLAAVSAPPSAPAYTRLNIYQAKGDPCSKAMTARRMAFYLPDNANVPTRLQPGESLWVEVTVPPAGPPRPIQLAISRQGVFTPLKFN